MLTFYISFVNRNYYWTFANFCDCRFLKSCWHSRSSSSSCCLNVSLQLLTKTFNHCHIQLFTWNNHGKCAFPNETKDQQWTHNSIQICFHIDSYFVHWLNHRSPYQSNFSDHNHYGLYILFKVKLFKSILSLFIL